MNKLMNQKLDITIAIPIYNGAKRIPEVLDKLTQQTGVENINWEIIIIDNNSTDNLIEVINNYQKTWNYKFTLNYFLENRQGAAFARMRAIREAKGEFVGFLDDDNIPASDWVIQAYTYGKENPQAGAWNGKIHGDFEIAPPENFARIHPFLAIREHGNKPFIFNAKNLSIPPSAGLVVRKQAWQESVPQKPIFRGRTGNSLIAGEDSEAILHIYKNGWQICYNPAMQVIHKIPHWRLEKDYLIKIARSSGLCIYSLRLINAKNWQKPLLFVRTFFGNFRRIILHYLNYKQSLKSNLIALVEVEFYLGSMISPFYSFKFYFDNLFQRL